MITARAILLEVKRRLGDTNTPYPDEVDALAFLNRALLGIYNYGVYMNSSILRKVVEYTTDAVGEATVTDGIAKIFGVANKTDSRILIPLYSLTDVLSIAGLEGASPYYQTSGDKITLYPATTETKEIAVDYIPQFVKLANRSSTIPFGDELFNVVVDWTVAIIQGKQATVSDFEFANGSGYANTLSQYFRGKQSSRLITGQGPW